MSAPASVNSNHYTRRSFASRTRLMKRSLDEYEDQLLQRIAAMHAGFAAGRAAFQDRA